MAIKRSFLKNYTTNVPQIFPLFAARISGVFTDVEAPEGESGKH